MKSKYSFEEIKQITKAVGKDVKVSLDDGDCDINNLQRIYAAYLNNGLPFIVLKDGRLWDLQKSKEISETDWISEYAADAACKVQESVDKFLRSKGYDRAPGETGRLIRRFQGKDFNEEEELERINRGLEAK